MKSSRQSSVVSRQEDDEETPSHSKEASKSFHLFFPAFVRAFGQIMGMGTDEGAEFPYMSIYNIERACIWRTLNGFRWKITIEREKVK
jgi:hypothetical protein